MWAPVCQPRPLCHCSVRWSARVIVRALLLSALRDEIKFIRYVGRLMAVMRVSLPGIPSHVIARWCEKLLRGISRSGLRALLLEIARRYICNRAGSAATRRPVYPVPSARNPVFPVRVFMLCVLGLYCSVRSSAIYARCFSQFCATRTIYPPCRQLFLRHCSLCNSKSIFSFVCCAFVSASVQTELLTSSKAGIPSTTESMLS